MNQQRDADAQAQGLELVRWYLEFALSSTATTWTMEQVGTPLVRALLQEYTAEGSPHDGRIDWEVFDMCNFGVPQVRKRLIAGSPKLIAKLRQLPRRRRSVRDVISVPRGTHIRGSTKWSSWGKIGTKEEQAKSGKRAVRILNDQPLPEGYHRGGPNGEHAYKYFGPDECCHSINAPVNCVTASAATLRWASPGTGTPLAPLTPREAALLQCFPEDYKLDAQVIRARRGIGNALPPLFMQRLLADADPLAEPEYATPISPSLLSWLPEDYSLVGSRDAAPISPSLAS